MVLTPETRIHFLGIGGTGLSAIATVLHEQGYRVSGCDQQRSVLSDALAARGVAVTIGHDPAHVADADVLVITSAAAQDHAEIQAARARGIPVLKRADFLGELMAAKLGVAVAGTHGKTTTTGLISHVLLECGGDPTFIVGGTLRGSELNARAGQGPAFVIEADEYDRMFLGLRPKIAVVTNIEHDHPDIYPALADMLQAFDEFAARLPEDGLLVACADDAHARALGERQRAAGRRVTFYGLQEGEWQASAVRANARGGTDAAVCAHGAPLGTLTLALPGEHNVLNALAALVVAEQFGIAFEQAAAALGEFQGVGRRFEVRGEAGGVTLIDDYGHHPTEIRATLAAARLRYPERGLWAVWQPHTYSRTLALLDEFAAAFAAAEHVIVTDIYASREHDTLGMSAAGVVERMRHADARAGGDLAAVTADLLARVRPGDVVVVFSAGDANAVTGQVLAGLAERDQMRSADR